VGDHRPSNHPCKPPVNRRVPAGAQKEKSKPLLLFYKNGSEVARVSGASTLELDAAINRLAKKKD
jgi:hypothetical protein